MLEPEREPDVRDEPLVTDGRGQFERTLCGGAAVLRIGHRELVLREQRERLGSEGGNLVARGVEEVLEAGRVSVNARRGDPQPHLCEHGSRPAGRSPAAACELDGSSQVRFGRGRVHVVLGCFAGLRCSSMIGIGLVPPFRSMVAAAFAASS